MAGLRFFGLLLSVNILCFANQVFCTNCSDLDSAVVHRIQTSLCDTLTLLQDDEYIEISIDVLGTNPPQSPPRDADSSERRIWKETVYDPWFEGNVALLVARADSLISQYDLRALDDTSRRIDSIDPWKEIPIHCSAKKSTIFKVAGSGLIVAVEKYFEPVILPVVKSVSVIRKSTKAAKREFYSLDGKRICFPDGARFNKARLSGILISVECSQKGGPVTKRVLIK